MNKHILLVMKWLNDKDSVTQEALNDNRTAADADAAYAAAYAAADAAADADADADAAYAAAYAAADAAADADSSERWIKKYFELTGENKQDYIDALTVKTKKAVLDAVIEFKGYFPSTLVDYDGWSYGWFQDATADSFNFQGATVCSFGEFNAYVDLLASNMGKSAQSYEEYKAIYNYAIGARTGGAGCAGYKSEPTVFTQEMADNGVLPSVGMECEFDYNEDFDCKFDFSEGDSLVCMCHSTDVNGVPIGVYRHMSGVTISLEIRLIKPITPPITLIGGKAYQFDIRGKYGKAKGIQGIYSEKLRVFQSSSNGFHEETVENIQPLTVEVK